MSSTVKILLSNSEEAEREALRKALGDDGFNVDAVATYTEVCEAITRGDYNLILTDIILGGENMLNVIREVKSSPGLRDTEIIIMTTFSTVDAAVQAIRAGASEYLMKPITDPDSVVSLVRKCCEKIGIMIENRRLLDELSIRNDELKRVNRELAELSWELLGLSKLSMTLNAAVDVQEITRLTCNTLCEILPGTKSVLLTVPEENQFILNVSASSPNLPHGTEKVFVSREAVKGEAQNAAPVRGSSPWVDAARGFVKQSLATEDVHVEAVRSGTEVLALLAVADGKVFGDRLSKLLGYLGSQLSLFFTKARLLEKLKNWSIRNPLTGLFNSNYYIERVAEEISRARRYQHYLSLLEIDIDKFRTFNERNGDQIAQDALRKVARLMKDSCRLSDVPVHHNVDRFAIILPETDKPGGRVMGERLLGRVSTFIFTPGAPQGENSLTLSAGLSAYPKDGEQVEDLLAKAESALTFAKKKGGNRLEMF